MRVWLAASLIVAFVSASAVLAAHGAPGPLQTSCRKALDRTGLDWSRTSERRHLVESLKTFLSPEQCHVFAAPWLAPNN